MVFGNFVQHNLDSSLIAPTTRMITVFCTHYYVQHNLLLVSYLDSISHGHSLRLSFPLSFPITFWRGRKTGAPQRSVCPSFPCRPGAQKPVSPVRIRPTADLFLTLPTHQKARVNENEKRAAGGCEDDEVDWLFRLALGLGREILCSKSLAEPGTSLPFALIESQK